jgi:hypothetical protein
MNPKGASEAGEAEAWRVCDVTVCPNTSVTAIIGEAGDLWLCAEHASAGRGIRLGHPQNGRQR